MTNAKRASAQRVRVVLTTMVVISGAVAVLVSSTLAAAGLDRLWATLLGCMGFVSALGTGRNLGLRICRYIRKLSRQNPEREFH